MYLMEVHFITETVFAYTERNLHFGEDYKASPRFAYTERNLHFGEDYKASPRLMKHKKKPNLRDMTARSSD